MDTRMNEDLQSEDNEPENWKKSKDFIKAGWLVLLEAMQSSFFILPNSIDNSKQQEESLNIVQDERSNLCSKMQLNLTDSKRCPNIQTSHLGSPSQCP